MTNKSMTLATADGEGARLKLFDNGDGTYSVASKAVIDQATPGTTNRSGTITAGATAQQLMAANASRRGWWFQNNSSGDLWLDETGTAVASQPSLKIPAGGYYEPPVVSLGSISIYGATTGQAFSAREW